MTPARRILTVLLLTLTTFAACSTAAAAPSEQPWAWPALGPVTRPYVQPAHPYGAGHRGIDIRTTSADIRAPADGVIAFAGRVVDRDVVTIDHGDGLVSSLEPVSTSLSAGDAVVRGTVVGRLSSGGHAGPGEVHFGVRRDGAYVNPLTLLGGVPRAVLLPCC